MRLSVWSAYYLFLTPEEMVLEFVKNGYNYCELSDEHANVLLQRGDPVEVGKQFKEFADKHDFKITQGHLMLNCRLCGSVDGVKSTDILKKWLDLFVAIGIKNAVLHCDSVSFPEGTSIGDKTLANIKALKILTDYIKDTDLVICLENLFGGSIVDNVDQLLAIVNQVDSKNIGICLDTGHLNLSDKNQTYFIEKAGKHLQALHIADNDGSGDQHLIPFGLGKINFHDIITSLLAIGYDGLFDFEIPGERACSMEIRALKLQYIKNIYNHLLKQNSTIG